MSSNRSETDALVDRGAHLYSKGDVAGALQCWKEALRRDPGHTEALAWLDQLECELNGALPDAAGDEPGLHLAGLPLPDLPDLGPLPAMDLLPELPHLDELGEAGPIPEDELDDLATPEIALLPADEQDEDAERDLEMVGGLGYEPDELELEARLQAADQALELDDVEELEVEELEVEELEVEELDPAHDLEGYDELDEPGYGPAGPGDVLPEDVLPGDGLPDDELEPQFSPEIELELGPPQQTAGPRSLAPQQDAEGYLELGSLELSQDGETPLPWRQDPAVGEALRSAWPPAPPGRADLAGPAGGEPAGGPGVQPQPSPAAGAAPGEPRSTLRPRSRFPEPPPGVLFPSAPEMPALRSGSAGFSPYGEPGQGSGPTPGSGARALAGHPLREEPTPPHGMVSPLDTPTWSGPGAVEPPASPAAPGAGEPGSYRKPTEDWRAARTPSGAAVTRSPTGVPGTAGVRSPSGAAVTRSPTGVPGAAGMRSPSGAAVTRSPTGVPGAAGMRSPSGAAVTRSPTGIHGMGARTPSGVPVAGARSREEVAETRRRSTTGEARGLTGRGWPGAGPSSQEMRAVLPGAGDTERRPTQSEFTVERIGTGSSPPVSDRSVTPTVESYVAQAHEALLRDDLDGALHWLKETLRRNSGDPQAIALNDEVRDHLVNRYLNAVGGRKAVVRQKMNRNELLTLQLDHRAGFLLSYVDGQTSVDELLDLSGMDALDTLSLLASLVEQGVLAI